MPICLLPSAFKMTFDLLIQFAFFHTKITWIWFFGLFYNRPQYCTANIHFEFTSLVFCSEYPSKFDKINFLSKIRRKNKFVSQKSFCIGLFGLFRVCLLNCASIMDSAIDNNAKWTLNRGTKLEMSMKNKT